MLHQEPLPGPGLENFTGFAIKFCDSFFFFVHDVLKYFQVSTRVFSSSCITSTYIYILKLIFTNLYLLLLYWQKNLYFLLAFTAQLKYLKILSHIFYVLQELTQIFHWQFILLHLSSCRKNAQIQKSHYIGNTETKELKSFARLKWSTLMGK